MFLFTWVKRLVFFAMFWGMIYLGSGYVDYHGKPVRSYVDDFFASDLWQEGKTDLLTWAAAVLHFAGDKVQEGITEADMKKLDDLISADMNLEVEVDAARYDEVNDMIKSNPRIFGEVTDAPENTTMGGNSKNLRGFLDQLKKSPESQ